MREWKGTNLAAFKDEQRHAVEAVDIQLHEISAAIKKISGNFQPQGGFTAIVGAGGSPALPNDGDYGDIRVAGGGLNWIAEQQANCHVIEVGTDLQPVIDSLGTAATIILNKGTYYANSSSPSTPLTITNTHHALRIMGMGDDYSVIASPLLIETSKVILDNLWVKPVGTAYGIKIFKSGSFLSRFVFRKVRVGATYQNAGDGPVNGVVLDGCGLLVAEQLNSSFNTDNGLLVDSTAAEPNTTLRFISCTFNGNGTAGTPDIGYGIKLLGSCSIAEFLNGNAESNVVGEFYADSMNNLRIIGFDFETGTTGIADQCSIQNCNPVEVRGCNFMNTFSGGATRGLFIAGSHGVIVETNRFANWGAVGVARIAESCTHTHVAGNLIEQSNGHGWIEDYSRP